MYFFSPFFKEIPIRFHHYNTTISTACSGSIVKRPNNDCNTLFKTSSGVDCLPDEGVNLSDINVVKFLHRLPDVVLVGAGVHDEHKGVVVLNLLHGSLSCQGVLDDVVGVHTAIYTICRKQKCAEKVIIFIYDTKGACQFCVYNTVNPTP